MRSEISVLAAAALLSGGVVMPAQAHEWRHHRDRDDGLDDVVAGAVIAGGIAAIASAIARGHRERQDAAVDACAHEAEVRTGGRVSDIAHVGRSKGYYLVDGAIDGPAPSDAAGPARLAFSCTIRGGSIYSFHTGPAEA